MPAFSILRLLAMLAVLLMPLAMAGGGHAAAAAPHGAATAAAQHGSHHGDSDRQEPRRHDGLAQCMMACAALPAMAAPQGDEAEPVRPLLFALPVLPIDGLAAEAATPPPRAA